MSPPPPRERPWYTHIHIDLLSKVIHSTILHPILSLFFPLAFVALSFRLHHPPLYWSIIYALTVNAYFFARLLNRRLAFGRSRPVDLDEEVVLITGGASGLGLLIAEVYGMRGVSVAVLDKEVPDGAEDEVRGVSFWKCDVGNPKEVERAKNEIEKELGEVTVLINNAAVVHRKPLLEASAQDVEMSYKTNIMSHYYTIRAFVPQMIAANRGTIVTVSSVLSVVPGTGTTLYAPTKAAATALHHAITAELKEREGIKTVLVIAGQMSTPSPAGVETPSTFFTPVVEPVDVAKAIISAVESGSGGEIAMPLYAYWINLTPALPYCVQRLLGWWNGVDTAIKGFGGSAKEQ